MTRSPVRSSRTWLSIAISLALAAPAFALAGPAGAQLAPPWSGDPISAGLGPTYGETWCADAVPGSSIANQQGAPLALMPQEAIGCTLDGFLAEATAAGIPRRMSYSVIGTSEAGRDLYGVVVNALETFRQRRDFARWGILRATMLDHPQFARSRLEAWGEDVKLPIFVEANIHGDEEEGTDAIMQVIRDLVTTPYGVNPEIDDLLDHAILIVIPSQNPDGRFAGTRGNGNGLDMNRDLLVQSQAEIRANVALQQRWLAPVGLAMHGYVNPTLIDGLTKPHNPGIDYDLFVKWNQPRLDANEAALAAAGMGITRPVNQWGTDADETPPVGPPYAEGWDDWGPFYTQTYMAFYGVDSSTLEMCRTGPACDGRFGSKRAQYLGFYSSADYWLGNRGEILHDQTDIFRRGVTGAARPTCCDDPDIAARGFTPDQHDWMVPYPEAFVIPFDGAGQRSDAEANRLVRWLLDNGIQVHRTTSTYAWGGTTFPRGSYVVWMDQAFRGLALTALDEGQDISERITQLYAPPGAWSHGALWGADVVEVPTRDASFRPRTFRVRAPTPLTGGVRPGSADWYSLTLRGVSEVRAVLDLLRAGIDGELAEEAFTSTSGGPSPAGTVIFPDDGATVASLRATGRAAGVVFERNLGAEPATTQLDEAPRIAILVNNANPPRSDISQSLRSIFGATSAGFVSTVAGAGSLQNAPVDPLAGFDVIYNAGQNFPGTTAIAAAPAGATQTGTTVTIQTTSPNHNVAAGSTVTVAGVGDPGYDGTFVVASVPTPSTFTYEAAISGLPASGGGTVAFTTARERLGAFFGAGGGYIGTSQSANNFAFLSGGGLVTTPLSPTSDQAGGGIARWTNEGVAGPLTGGYPAEDFLYLPSNVTFFSAVPADAVVDGRYLPDATSMFVAGLWRDRDPAAAGAPMIVHGGTTAGGRYLGLATNPLSRMDAEREWLLIGQAALWSNLTDEG